MHHEYHIKRLPSGEPDVDQGRVHGLPVTFNPDDCRFYIHAADVTDGTGVLGHRADWRNAVQLARHIAKTHPSPPAV